MLKIFSYFNFYFHYHFLQVPLSDSHRRSIGSQAEVRPKPSNCSNLSRTSFLLFLGPISSSWRAKPPLKPLVVCQCLSVAVALILIMESSRMDWNRGFTTTKPTIRLCTKFPTRVWHWQRASL